MPETNCSKQQDDHNIMKCCDQVDQLGEISQFIILGWNNKRTKRRKDGSARARELEPQTAFMIVRKTGQTLTPRQNTS
jgi:hypothetical protein